MMNTELKGLYPALITPYHEDKSIHFSSLEKLIEKLIAEGVTGFYITGSTGECFLLSTAERKEIIRFVLEKTGKRVKTIVHVGSTNTNESVELAAAALEYGADAISAVPPFYYKYSFPELKAHYFRIMDSCPLPMILYNFPAMSGVTFTADNIKELCTHPNLAGIKHTSKDLYELEKFKRVGSNLVVFNGHDECMLSGLAMGADGAIGSTFNILFPHIKKIKHLYQENRMEEALQVQIFVNQIIDILIESGVNQGIKYVLEKKDGIECNGCRMPMKEISESSAKKLDAILDRI